VVMDEFKHRGLTVSGPGNPLWTREFDFFGAIDVSSRSVGSRRRKQRPRTRLARLAFLGFETVATQPPQPAGWRCATSSTGALALRNLVNQRATPNQRGTPNPRTPPAR
jgi:hypothetical protein